MFLIQLLSSKRHENDEDTVQSAFGFGGSSAFAKSKLPIHILRRDASSDLLAAENVSYAS